MSALAQSKYASDVLALNPLGYWRLDGNANDATSNGDNGTLMNGTTFTGPGGGAPIGDPTNRAAVFNISRNQFISIPAGEPASGTLFDIDWNQPISMMIWVRTSNTTSNMFLLAKEENSGNFRGPYIFIDNGTDGWEPAGAGRFVMIIESANSNNIRVSSVAAVNDGNWHFLVGTYDGSGQASGVHLYIDGSESETNTRLNTLNGRTTLNNVPVTIGARDMGGVSYNGLLDEASIFGTVLTAAQVRQLADDSATVSTSQPPFSQSGSYTISTVVGRDRLGDGGPATSALFYGIGAVAVDSAGNLYVADASRVRKVSPSGVIDGFAGAGPYGFSGDGGPAAWAQIHGPQGLTADRQGNVYIADSYNHRIRKVTPDGVIRTVAGTGAPGFSGDGGPATAAQLNFPKDVTVDSTGNLYIADLDNHRVRKVTPDGVIHTVAGFIFQAPFGVAADSSANIYIADFNLRIVVKLTATGVISIVAGNGTGFYDGDGVSAKAAAVAPVKVAVDSSGNLYIADPMNHRVRKVTPDGVIHTLAGTGSPGSSGDGGNATLAQLVPDSLAVDAAGNLIIGDENGFIRKVTPDGIISTIAGVRPVAGEPTPVLLYGARGLHVDASGNLYIVDGDSSPRTVRKLSADGFLSEVAGVAGQLSNPDGVALDAQGNLYIADNGGCKVVKVTPGGVALTAAGTGKCGYSGDGGAASSAQVSYPNDVAVDRDGNLYIADSNNHRIRKVTASGVISTVAGGAAPGFGGDGVPATTAQLNFPNSVVVDGDGNLYISDGLNNRVRKVSSDGVIRTVAGTGDRGFGGDDLPATLAELAVPSGIALDNSGNLYIADHFNNRVRRVTPSGIINTIAGNGVAGSAGDGGPANLAQLNTPFGVAVDGAGNVYVSEFGNPCCVRKLTPVQITAAGVLNGASLQPGPVAPGELINIRGSAIGPDQLAKGQPDGSGLFTTSVGGTQVLFDGIPAPLFSAQSGSVSAFVPYEVAGKQSTRLQIVYQGKPTNTVTLPVADAAPGIFTQDGSGTGPGLVFNQDNTLNSPSNPASNRSVVSFYATGLGQTDPSGEDGKTANDVYLKPIQPVSVSIGGVDAEVVSASVAPTFTQGMFLVYVKAPDGVAQGDSVPVVLTVGGVNSQPGVVMSVIGPTASAGSIVKTRTKTNVSSSATRTALRGGARNNHN